MPSKYKSNRERVKEMIENVILEIIKEKDIDYNSTIKYIVDKEGVSENLAREMIDVVIRSGRLKHISIITIPDNQIGISLETIERKEKNIKKELKEVLGNGETRE